MLFTIEPIPHLVGNRNGAVEDQRHRASDPADHEDAEYAVGYAVGHEEDLSLARASAMRVALFQHGLQSGGRTWYDGQQPSQSGSR